MNFGEVINTVSKAVDRDDLLDNIRDYVNQGSLTIQKEHSWRWQRSRYLFTVQNGDVVAQLPGDFKEMVGEREALAEITIPSAPSPWFVYAEPQGNRYNAVAWSSRSIATLDWQQGFPQIRFPFAITGGPRNFSFFYYQFLPNLVSDEQVNVITTQHTQMLIEKGKEICFAAVQDPAYKDCAARYEYYKNRDVAADMQADLSGRSKVPKDVVQLARSRLSNSNDASGTSQRLQTGGDKLT